MSEKQKPQNPIFLPCEGWESNKVKKVDNGGPAFPVLEYEYKASGDLHPSPTLQPGMTLRDWFAGMALDGLISSSELPTTHAEYAQCAYEHADAMIAQRNKI